MPADWPSLLRIARSLIRQVNQAASVIDHWTLGGGTALMLRVHHRESRDIDIFLADPQQLAFLDPTKRDFDFEMALSGHTGDGAKFLKFAFAGLGEIDFIVAAHLTSSPSTESIVDGAATQLETVAEIITKKICHRGLHLKPRDIFDIAASAEAHANSIIKALRGYKEAVAAATSAMDKLNPDFVRRAIDELAILPGFEMVARTAAERAKELLRAV